MIYEYEARVPFHDLDPLQVVWHGNYLKYFDIARFGLFRQAGLDLYRYFLDHQLIFPVTRSSTKHIVPLRHDDAFVCKATVTEAVYKIAMSFEIRLTAGNQVCTRGTSEQVAVKMPEMEMQFEVPGDISAALGFA
ncbi:MAG: thioesterase family protein [Desulfobacterales bacterium]